MLGTLPLPRHVYSFMFYCLLLVTGLLGSCLLHLIASHCSGHWRRQTCFTIWQLQGLSLLILHTLWTLKWICLGWTICWPTDGTGTQSIFSVVELSVWQPQDSDQVKYYIYVYTFFYSVHMSWNCICQLSITFSEWCHETAFVFDNLMDSSVSWAAQWVPRWVWLKGKSTPSA